MAARKSPPKPDWLLRLHHAAGAYHGVGRNHEGERFAGKAALLPIVQQRGVALVFAAQGEDGSVLHEEHSLIAPDEAGIPAMWTLDTDTPGLRRQNLTHIDLTENGPTRLVFSSGDPADSAVFRIETALDLAPGALTLRWAWALPGDELREQSRIQMTETDGASHGTA